MAGAGAHGLTMRVIGLTGGTGSGKSEAAGRFEAHGIPVLNADQIGHEVIAPGGQAEAAVADAFGPEILTDGVIDRKKLGALVFDDANARRRLNAIAHPAIISAIKERCERLGREGHRLVIIDAALIAEDGVKPGCLDGLILVKSSEAERAARLMAARDWSEAETWRRIRAQTPPEDKLALADWILDNDGPLTKLYAQVDELVGIIGGDDE